MQNDKLSKERSYFIAKSNELITRTRYSLTLQQQKILLYFISQIKPTDEKGTIYVLSIKDFAKICGYVEDSGYYYQTIKADVQKLRNTSCWIEVENGREILFSWLNTAEINRNNGTLKVSFHCTVEPYLFELREKYTQYSLYNILCLSHKYSIRLYEYLLSMRYKKTFIVSIDELKKRMDAENYIMFNRFKERALEPAITDIVCYTDLNITCNYIKTGKAITHIKFVCNAKEDFEIPYTYNLQEIKINPQLRNAYKKMKIKATIEV